MTESFDPEIYSPYCPVCEACGEEGCCSPLNCKQDVNGMYCEGYLDDLKLSYRMLQRLLIKMYETPAKYADLIIWYEELYEHELNKLYGTD